MNQTVRTVERPSSPILEKIATVTRKLEYSPNWDWAWTNYRRVIEELTVELGLYCHLEIGAGRDPTFSPGEARRLGAKITLNDISADELQRAPAGLDAVCFDIAGDITAVDQLACFDFLYSCMVMEHVTDMRKMWRNCANLLRTDGIAFAFFPTLYAPPYAMNYILPDSISAVILKFFFPDRGEEGGNPKFPAVYDHCFAVESKVLPIVRDCGFRDVLLLPFYGHSYFRNIPVLRELDSALAKIAVKRDWRYLASCAFLFAIR